MLEHHHPLPEAEPMWCIDKFYPRIRKLPQYALPQYALPQPETIRQVNELFAAGKAPEAYHVLDDAATRQDISNAVLLATEGFSCPALIKAYTFKRSRYSLDYDELPPLRLPPRRQ